MKTITPDRHSLVGESRPSELREGSEPVLRVRLARLLLQGRGWTVTRFAVDATFLILAVEAARYGAPDALGTDGQALVWLFPPLTLLVFALRLMYRGEMQVRVVDGLGTVVAATSLVAALLIAFSAFTSPNADTAPLIARAWVFATLYVAGARLMLVWGQRLARVSGLIGKPTLIVGAGRIGVQVERRLREQPELGLRPLGYLDADPPPAEMAPGRLGPILGHPSDLARVADETGARHVVLGFTSSPDSLLMPLVRECEARRLEISLVPRLFESVNVRIDLEHIGGLPLFALRAVDPKGWQFAIKHGLDRIVAGGALLVLSPVLLAVAAAVRGTSTGPIFFRQRRIGRDGRDFSMLKFRSMRIDSRADRGSERPAVGAGLAPGGVEGDDRRTSVGAFIRSTSLDELPQLLNVLFGQMSLVGPRPERPEFVELFGQSVNRYDDRHRVKSGITGWAQVNGLRGKTSVSDRIEWDNYYISNWSLALDLRILVLTLAAVLRGSE
ncbi:MAG: sugar transferase [Thermoleophilaceae bacterium]